MDANIGGDESNRDATANERKWTRMIGKNESDRQSIQMDARSRRLDEISNRVIGAALTVSNTLGVGFLEKVYENALAHELRKVGLAVEQQRAIQVEYDGVLVGDYVADILVEGDLLVELKAVKALDEIHMAQCMNYLKATGRRLCMLLNFGNTKLQIKRVVRNF